MPNDNKHQKKMEENGDGSECRTKDRHEDSECRTENVALNAK